MGNLVQALRQQRGRSASAAPPPSSSVGTPPHGAVAAPNSTRDLVHAVRRAVQEKSLDNAFFRDTLQPLMSGVSFQDLGLKPPPASQMPLIGYMSLEERPEYTICFFFIPPGKTLPLHDHPSMNIVQKVVFGNVRVRGFDWVKPRGEYIMDVPEGLAYEVYNKVFTADDGSTFIEPDAGGVLHEISAEGDGVAGFVDCISPSYVQFVRDCTYFTTSPPLNKATFRDVVAAETIADVESEGVPAEAAFDKGYPVHILKPDFANDGPEMRGFKPPSPEWLN